MLEHKNPISLKPSTEVGNNGFHLNRRGGINLSVFSPVKNRFQDRFRVTLVLGDLF